LGIYRKELVTTGEEVQPESDGFIKPKDRGSDSYAKCPFRRSPLPFLKGLMGLRRKGMEYAPTHIGKLLQGRLLKETDF